VDGIWLSHRVACVAFRWSRSFNTFAAFSMRCCASRSDQILHAQTMTSSISFYQHDKPSMNVIVLHLNLAELLHQANIVVEQLQQVVPLVLILDAQRLDTSEQIFVRDHELLINSNKEAVQIRLEHLEMASRGHLV
jgi:N-dimethylarginine dimethylaminohydrolase